jgi:hypothetical protein
LISLPRSTRARGDFRNAGDAALEQVGGDGGGPQQHGERENALDDGQDRDPEPAYHDRDAVEQIERRPEQMHDVEGGHHPGEHRDQPRQSRIGDESRGKADHQPGEQQVDGRLGDRVRPSGALGNRDGNP